MNSFFMGEQDKKRTRIEGLRRSLQTTDRALYGHPIRLHLESGVSFANGNIPAWSTKESISINLDRIDDPLSPSGMATILGLNYHEVAHMLYSPVRNYDLYEQLEEDDVHTLFDEAFTYLEEARVETIYAARYPRMKKWFTYPVIDFFVNDPDTWKTAFLYTHGRRYIPEEVRNNFRRIFEENFQTADQYADLIDRYRFLSVAKKEGKKKAAEIINEFAALLEADEIEDKPKAHGGKSPTGGSADTSEQQEEDAEHASSKQRKQDQREKEKDSKKNKTKPSAAEEEEQKDGDSDAESEQEPDGGQEDEEHPEDEEHDPEDGGGEDDDPADSEDDSDGGGDSEDDGDDGDDSGQEGDAGEEDPEHEESDSSGGSGEDAGQDGDPSDGPGGDDNDAPSGGAGVGGGNENAEPAAPPTEEEFKDALSEVLSSILDSRQAQEELSALQDAMDDSSALSSLVQRRLYPQTARVTEAMVQKSSAVADVLRQIWAQMDSGWIYGTDEGSRLDMNRAAMASSAEDYDSIYDDWIPGQQENAGLEVVILADESGSTANHIAGTRDPVASVISRNIWELMSALQEVDSVTTVISFQSNCTTVYDRNDRVTAADYVLLSPQGGTQPAEAITEARRILSMSEQPNKLLLFLTDGDWYQGPGIEMSLELLSGDVTRVCILLGGYTGFRYPKLFDLVINTNGDILEPMSMTVVSMMERMLSSR